MSGLDGFPPEYIEMAWEAFEERFGVEVTAIQCWDGERLIACLSPGNLIYCDDFHYVDTGEPAKQPCCDTHGMECMIEYWNRRRDYERRYEV